MNRHIPARIEALHAHMRDNGLAAVIIPHVDPHQSEYMSSHWHAREYFSGFNGSAGTLVVTLHDARLWTDSRYFLQASAQLADTGIALMKDGLPATPSIPQWLSAEISHGKVGVDATLFPVTRFNELNEELTRESNGKVMLSHGFDVDTLWENRPSLPASPLIMHSLEYSGQSTSDKIAGILALIPSSCDGMLLTRLDEIAWLLNLRGNDVEFNPVFYAYLYLSRDSAHTLFVESTKVTPDIHHYLDSLGIAIVPYSSALHSFRDHAPYCADFSSLPAAFLLGAGHPAQVSHISSPVPALKAVRNPTQIRGLHKAMVIEGRALVNAFYTLDSRLDAGILTTELDMVRILSDCRRELSPDYISDSFGSIVGYREHAAIVHYEPTPETNAVLRREGLLLVDTGGQYPYGTTDITRTIALGTPTPEECHDFTLVLKGNIALASAIFPEGTRGAQLDVLARQFLWHEGKNYLHGTGHGVGHFLNVHEGPQSIRLQENPVPIRPGMLTSDEPGLYLEGHYGIRCENLVLCVPAINTPDGTFLRFDTVSLFPFDLSLLDTSILTPDEMAWIDSYHTKVYTLLAPGLEEPQRRWLETRCRPIS